MWNKSCIVNVGTSLVRSPNRCNALFHKYGVRRSISETNREALKTEMLAQIHCADFGVIKYCVGITRSNNDTFSDDVGFLANIEGLAHIVIGDEHTDIFIAQMLND